MINISLQAALYLVSSLLYSLLLLGHSFYFFWVFCLPWCLLPPWLFVHCLLLCMLFFFFFCCFLNCWLNVCYVFKLPWNEILVDSLLILGLLNRALSHVLISHSQTWGKMPTGDPIKCPQRETTESSIHTSRVM